MTSKIRAIRLQTKRLRSLLHLLEPACPNEMSPLLKNVREIARALSGARDQEVMLKWIARLKEAAPDAGAFETWTLLEGRLMNARAGIDSSASQARRVHQSMQSLEIAQATFRRLLNQAQIEGEIVLKGMAREYRRARRDFESAQANLSKDSKNAELRQRAFHEWRKRIKRLQYQLEAAPFLTSTRVLKTHKRLKRLARLTGEAHDLAVLEAWMLRQPSDETKPAAYKAALRQLRKEMKRRERTALRKGRKVFSPPPKKWRRTLVPVTLSAPSASTLSSRHA